MRAKKYYVVYDKWDGRRTMQVQEVLGQFLDDSAAISAARDYEFRTGTKLADLRKQSRLSAILEATGEAVAPPLFRLVRVVVACALALLVFPILTSMQGLANIPFSQMTLAMLVSAGFKGALIVGLAFLCVSIAFGSSGRPPAY